MSESTCNLQIHAKLYDYENANPMSHEEATEINAVEMYVLRDLTPEQEQRFEEHYFECQECACAVAVEQALLVPKMAAKVAREPWWRRWTLPILAPVSAALLGLVVFQNAELSRPLLAANTEIVAREIVKGGAPEGKSISTPSATIEMVLRLEEAPRPFYRVVVSGGKKGPLSEVVPAPEGDRLSVQVPKAALGSGAYDVLVYGLPAQNAKDGPPIGHYYFSIN